MGKEYEKIRQEVAKSYKGTIHTLRMENQKMKEEIKTLEQKNRRMKRKLSDIEREYERLPEEAKHMFEVFSAFSGAFSGFF